MRSCAEDESKLRKLKDYAFHSLTYALDDDLEASNLVDDERYLLSDAYKRSVIGIYRDLS